jgi:hypothetical protein
MASPVKRVPAVNRVNGVQPRPRPEVEVGVSQYLPFITPFQNAWEMLRSDDITVRQLQAMRKTDGQARALYRLITLPIRAALKTATFVPETNIDGGEDEAQFVEQMFTLPASAGGMVIPFSRVIAQLLMAIFDGFTAHELVYWSPKEGPLKGKWTLKKFAYRPAETLSFLIDDNSEFAGFRQRAMFQGRNIDVKIPAEHAIYYAANEEEKPFYGRSYFEAAFYHWDKKFKLYVIAHIAAQRAAVGTRVATLPKNPNRDELEEIKKALADLGVAQYMTIPEDYKIEQLKEGPSFDFLAYINHHNSQMSKSVLAAFFDDQQGSGGDTTLVDFGRQSDALFMMMLDTIMGEVEEVINSKVIPRFIDWNFGSAKYPKFQFGSLTQEQKAASVDLFKTLSVAGQALTISEEFVHELEKQVAEQFGLEIDWEAVEQAQEEQKLLEAQQATLGTPPGGPGSPAGGPTAPAPAASPVVDPALLPPGFTLSHTERDPSNPDFLTLTQEARQLLQDAADGLAFLDEPTGEPVELTRGVPNSGQPKRVQTPAGAQAYGVPIGTPITRDMAQRTAKEGVKGKNFGGGIRDPQGDNKGHQKLGGGLGAKAQNPGGVVTDPTNRASTPKRLLSHPEAPGVILLDFGDGTFAIRNVASGAESPRQKFNLADFTKRGWTAATPAPGAAKKATARKTRAASRTDGQ